MKPAVISDEWRVGLHGWRPESVEAFESLLSIGNGRFGQRANFEEDYSGSSLRGSYLAGVYYPDKTRVGWWKNGYPEYFAKVLNSTNWIGIPFTVNGEAVDLHHAQDVRDFKWEVDMRSGILKRSFVIATKNGVELCIESERFCSMERPDTAVIRYAVRSLSGNVDVEMAPFLDGAVSNADSNWNDAFWKFHNAEAQLDGTAHLHCETEKSGFHAAFAMTCKAAVVRNGNASNLIASGFQQKDAMVSCQYAVTLQCDESIVIEKYVGISSSIQVDATSIVESAQHASKQASQLGVDALRTSHCKAWKDIWTRGDIKISGDVASQQGIRFNVFHLNQTYRGDDPKLNIGPKGFTGEKYGGASYWDTEAYCLPFFLAGHEPKVAKQLLLYRFNHLPKAIENAQKLGFDGGAALYPMVTMNGEECHNEWEITFEEIHRNGAMAYAISNYVNYTGDRKYLLDYGFEVLLAIARFWEQRVQWSASKEAFVILGVTGPNEYENNVNNNWYTNYLASWCLKYTLEVSLELQRDSFTDWLALSEKLGFDVDDTKGHWTDIIEKMYYPSLAGTSVFLQQDGFMDKEQKVASDLKSSERPINQHWSWDRILRSIYIKQADVLQGIYFFWDQFSREEIESNYDFYEPKTLHESSLSPCVHAVIAARLNRAQEAYDHYLRTARLDLDDYNAEVHEGLHITSMAGTWLSVIEGFGGFRVVDGMPCFDGVLPREWGELRYRIQFRGRDLEVSTTHKLTKVVLKSGDSLDVMVNGKSQWLVGIKDS